MVTAGQEAWDPGAMTVLDENVDRRVIIELEPVVAAETERHISMAKPWYPHDYIPWDEGRNFALLGGEEGQGQALGVAAAQHVAPAGEQQLAEEDGQRERQPERIDLFQALDQRRELHALDQEGDQREGNRRLREDEERLPGHETVAPSPLHGRLADAAYSRKLALDAIQPTGEAGKITVAYGNLGRTYQLLGQYGLALQYYQQSLRLMQPGADDVRRQMHLLRAAQLNCQLQQYVQARQLLAQMDASLLEVNYRDDFSLLQQQLESDFPLCAAD